MQKSIIVVDDFYDDPHTVRDRALELEFARSEDAFYAGKNSKLALINTAIVNSMSQLIGAPVIPSPNSTIGHFRIAFAEDTARQDVHVDPNRDWGGVLYLTPPEYCQGGTSFFRHKRLGIERMPSDPDEIKRLGYFDYEQMRTAIVEKDGQDRDKWELTMTVPMRFNRLILFRSWFWHSFTENFGDRLENCRLVQIFFFDYAARYARAPGRSDSLPFASAGRR